MNIKSIKTVVLVLTLSLLMCSCNKTNFNEASNTEDDIISEDQNVNYSPAILGPEKYLYATLITFLPKEAGYINQFGDIEISGYDIAYNYSDGLALVEKNNQYLYINSLGEEQFGATFEYARPFYNGLAVVCPEGEIYQLINVYGEVLFTSEHHIAIFYYDTAGARVTIDNNTIGVLDARGEILFSLRSDEFQLDNGFSEGFLAAKDKNGNLVYLDKNGEIVIETGVQWELFDLFYPINRFSCGVAYIGDGEYIDSQGNVVFSGFEDGRPFSEGLAAVKINGKWGYINLEGELVIPANYTYGEYFSEGVAMVGNAETGYSCYIDIYGNALNEYMYSTYSSETYNYSVQTKMKNGLIYVVPKEMDWIGYIDKNGEIVYKTSFFEQ